MFYLQPSMILQAIRIASNFVSVLIINPKYCKLEPQLCSTYYQLN